MKPSVRGEDVEWGYAFDVHLNAYFPALIILHIVQSIFYHGTLTYSPSCFLRIINDVINRFLVLISQDWYSATLFGNTLWLIAVGYYVYINFLGYSCKYCQSRVTLQMICWFSYSFCSFANPTQDTRTSLSIFRLVSDLHRQPRLQLERYAYADRLLSRQSPRDMKRKTKKYVQIFCLFLFQT